MTLFKLFGFESRGAHAGSRAARTGASSLDVLVYHMTTTPKKFNAWAKDYFQTISSGFCTEQERIA